MAYLQSREHDVFVSYAHVDNIPDVEGEKGWVERFERLLSIRLMKRFGEQIDVWRDPELDRAQLFDKVIEKAVRGSGVMVALISRRYLKSAYCGQEIDWFRDQAETEPAGLVVDDYLRIFPVLLYNIPHQEWPEACHGASAFTFHDGEGEDFGEPLDPGGEAFQKQLRRLVEEIHTVLTRFARAPGKAKAEALAAEDPPSAPFRVFLSEPADDLGPTRRQLAAALSREGIEVTTGLPPPHEEKEHAAAVRDAVERADLSIHLLSERPGEPLDEDDPDKTFPLEQLRVGLEHARSQLVLMPEELDPELVESPAYRDLLRELGERERDAARFEMVRTGRYQMLDEVRAKRRKLEEAAQRETEAVASTLATAFIDLHTHDVPFATDLVGYLARHEIAPMMIPATDLSPSMGMALFEENLKKSGLFLVVFGTVARAWVEHRLQEAFKLILSHQLETRIGVYVAPPEKPPDQVKFPNLFDVANNMSGFDPGTLDAILKKAGGPRP